MDFFESGLLRYHVKSLLPVADECFASKRRKDSKQQAIRLPDLTSAFLILGIGTLLALLTFISELALKRVTLRFPN